ncbi:hypothetical protein MTBBW1_10045 [Desulfamplus magnetovallimortis]|uniref:Uncharacterized protein n=1 Tax=Desulfamplus magnetovallimortis TaxID=1246637 RepID=A0A1W1H4K2_9BACT|nr:hypothetical protein MTBBW1_10045 [Desulfamplus magnetovallimortis]
MSILSNYNVHGGYPSQLNIKNIYKNRASFISCRKYFTLSGTVYQKNGYCVQESVTWQMKDAKNSYLK